MGIVGGDGVEWGSRLRPQAELDSFGTGSVRGISPSLGIATVYYKYNTI